MLLSLSRVPVSDVFAVRFSRCDSDSESNVQGTKEKEIPENPKPQSSELVDEVFSLFKGYLNTQLEAQGKLIEDHFKIEGSGSEFNSRVIESSLR